jgi:hypothetical protein
VEDEPPAASARNRALPPSVDAVLTRGMAKRPEQRWPTARDFAQALEAALTEAPTRVYRTGAGGAAAAAAVGAGRGSRASTPARPGRATPPGRAQPPRMGTGAGTSGRRRRFRGARVPALAALLAGAVVAVAVAGTIGSGGSSGTHSTAGARREASASTKRHKPPAPRPKTQTSTHAATVTATPAAATTPAPLAETLEAQGHQLMVDGNYAAAIPVLRQAVAAASPGSLPYAYALYDLGRSLRLAGDPVDAVRVLYQRLQIPNQTETVRAQLQLALLALGETSQSGGAGAGPGKHGRHDHPFRTPGADGGGGPHGPAAALPAPPSGAGDSQGD